MWKFFAFLLIAMAVGGYYFRDDIAASYANWRGGGEIALTTGMGKFGGSLDRSFQGFADGIGKLGD